MSGKPTAVSATGGETRNDWVKRPGMGFVWWCLPLVIGFASNFFSMAARATALVWMASFIWMGTGCTLNARRCHRLHCYISGPAFFLGAAALALFAAGIALLSFLPEMIWRKYV